VPAATGILRYGPQSQSVPRKGWWAVLVCDRDWFLRYGAEAQRELTPQFVEAVDEDRLFEGQFVDRTPRLAIYRPPLFEPAWHPHISITRGEKPTRHLDLWGLGVKVGDLMDAEEHAVESAKYLRDKAVRLQEALEAVDPRKTKYIRKAEAEIADTLRVAKGRDKALVRAQTELQRTRTEWRKAARKAGVPLWFAPGTPVEFGWDPECRSSGHHWWFPVKSKLLLNLRQVYGLRRQPRLPLHLTFAVAEGYEDVR